MSYAPYTKQTETVFCSTQHYLWDKSPTNVLGRGATAVVYKASVRDTGEDCAVKVFHDRVSHHYSSVPIRELEIVSRLNHKNVIRIFGIDVEPHNGNKVLGMEFCAGGSVYTQLDQPENYFGFPEEEFIIVLRDIAHGMRYLRDNGIIHRDIKPGNIMKFIDEDGRSVYKLTDFGAARQLEEEENFMSIYGTEEYLDPAMYNQAVLKNQYGQQFSANVDIWSLGVTIYHVATGQLPFQPYGGRANTATMYKITTEKESGVISGVQRYNDGPIEYKKELPRTCLLSPCLKSRIVPVLGGLMESNLSKRWSYDKFFNAVDELIQTKIFKVFDCSSGMNIKVYISKTDRFAKLQDLVAMETEIPATDQLILHHNRELSEMVDATLPVDLYPKRLLVDQLYVYSKERMDRQNLTLPEIPPFPNMPEHTSLDKDSHYLHKVCGIGNHILKVIELCIQHQQLMQESEVHLRDHILLITNKINNCLPDMSLHLEENKKRQETFYESYKNLMSLIMTLESELNGSKPLERLRQKLRPILADDSPKDVLRKAENRCEEVKVYMSVLVEKMKEQEQEAISSCHSCLEEDRCVQKTAHLCSLLKDIWQMFNKHRKQRNLSTDEEFIHNARKAKSQEYSGQILSVLDGHCKMNLKQTYNSVMKQNGLLVKNLQRTKKVNQNITSVMDCRGKLSDRIDKMDNECRKLTKELIETLAFCLKTEGASAAPVKMNTQTQLKRQEESLMSHEPWSSIGLEKISLGLKSLLDSRRELEHLMTDSKKSLDETMECLQSMDVKFDDHEAESDMRIVDGSSMHPLEDPQHRHVMAVQITENKERCPDGLSTAYQPTDAN